MRRAAVMVGLSTAAGIFLGIAAVYIALSFGVSNIPADAIDLPY